MVGERGEYEFGPDGTESISEAVVAAVATSTGADPLAMEPLYEAVDPDALERLLAAGADDPDRSVTVTFAFTGHEVTARSDGRIRVTETGD